MRVNVGDFIVAKYRNFSGEITKGIFLVIYHEVDDLCKTSLSFTAVKVSSNPSGYQIPITKESFTFLNHDSYINCSTLHKFLESEVLDILGRCKVTTLTIVSKQLKSYFNSIDNQINNRLKFIISASDK